MYCPKCGAKVDEGKNFCPKCGAPLARSSSSAAAGGYQTPPYQAQAQQAQQQPAPEVRYVQQVEPQKKVEDSGSAGWGVLGFFIPLVGFILWLVWKDEKPKSAKNCGVGALIGIIFVVIVNAAIPGCTAAMLSSYYY